MALKLLKRLQMDDQKPNFTIRIKLVDLNYTGLPAAKSAPRNSSAHVSALVAASSERNIRPQFTGSRSTGKTEYATGEVCLRTRDLIQHSDFETHIETCAICANRVDLQLDFINTLETAIYQSHVQPGASKVRGALLVSSPELNFAICGELE